MSGIGGRILKTGSVDVRAIAGNSKNHKYVLDKFQSQPIAVQNDGTAASGTDAEINLLNTGAAIYELYNNQTATIIVPIIEADGLDLGRDKTDNDGFELTLGITSRSKCAFTVGDGGRPFFVRAKFKIADVSGTDDFALGFRKAEAYQAAIDDYDEMAALNVISGNVTVETILNAGTTAATDTTFNWADTEVHELYVQVAPSGAVSYKINGVKPGEGSVLFDGDGAAMTAEATVGVPPFTFDAGEVVIPFVYGLHATTSPGKLLIREFECGYVQNQKVAL